MSPQLTGSRYVIIDSFVAITVTISAWVFQRKKKQLKLAPALSLSMWMHMTRTHMLTSSFIYYTYAIIHLSLIFMYLIYWLIDEFFLGYPSYITKKSLYISSHKMYRKNKSYKFL
jgi:hypothetical protein